MLHARTFQTVSLTENINIHACGGELAGLYTFTRDCIGFIYDKRARVVHSADIGTFLKRVTFRTGLISSCFRLQMRNNA